MIAEWQATDSDEPTPLIALVRQLQWDDPAKRRLILNELKAATGIGFRDLNLPPAVDLEALAAREARQRAFANERGDLLDPSEPLDVVRRFQAHNADVEGFPEIVRWNGDYLKARGTHYEITTDEAINAALYAFTDGKRDVATGAPVKPDRAMIEELNHALKAVAGIDVANPPAWLSPRRGDPAAADVIALSNGLLSVAGGRDFLPPTRRFFTLNSVGFPYAPDAPRPVQWERFLDDVWPDDVESRETLQELMGLLLTGDTRYQKIFMLIGPKRSGKGTIGRVLQALVGEGNHCSPTLNGLGGPFGAESLIGKRLAMIGDARLGHRADVSTVAERLLSISGEDSQTVDRKHRTAWTAGLSVRFVIMTNEVPALLDQSGALASRFVILRMTRSFYGKEDHSLTSRLLQELPGIFLWALEGLDRLRARGQFRQPKSAAEMVDQLDTLASPIKAFVRERCELNSVASVECATLYSEYRRWAESQGRERPQTHPVFTRDLGSAFPEVVVTRPRNADGEQVRHYRGIRLRVIDLRVA
jgi:putative DNA primase/helicase